MRCSLLAVVAALALALPWAARADQHELYTELVLEPALIHVDDPTTHATSVTQLGAGASVVGYYGLTNALHVGLALHGSYSPNLKFEGQTAVVDSAGSKATGALFEDTFAIGAAALVAYRLDTGSRFAPVGRLELGGTYLRYPNIVLNPVNTTLGVSLPALDTFALTARAVIALEYRFADHWVVSAGLSARLNLGLDFVPALTPWELQLPITIGYVWW